MSTMTITLPPKLAEAIRWHALHEGFEPQDYVIEGLAERISSELVVDGRTMPGVSQTELEADLLGRGRSVEAAGVN